MYTLNGINEAASFYKLSNTQLVTIKQSQQQIKEGNYFTNEQVDKETGEWPKK